MPACPDDAEQTPLQGARRGGRHGGRPARALSVGTILKPDLIIKVI